MANHLYSVFSKSRFSALLLSGLLGIAAVLITAPSNAAVYKWVDENGVTQYSSTPPPDQKASKLHLAPPPSQAETDRAIQDLKRRLSKSRAQDEQDQANADLSAKRAAEKKAAFAGHCHQARQNLLALQQLGRVFSFKDNGERDYVSDKERPAQIQKLQDFISDNCQ